MRENDLSKTFSNFASELIQKLHRVYTDILREERDGFVYLLLLVPIHLPVEHRAATTLCLTYIKQSTRV